MQHILFIFRTVVVRTPTDRKIALGLELYSTLGLMMDHYRTSTDKVTNFFDLETIRNHVQSVFRSNINLANYYRNLLIHFMLMKNYYLLT